MGRLLILFTVSCVAAFALIRPWVSICGYYLYTIWGPQYIWWWHFQGLRIANILAIGAILGVGINCFRKNHYNFKFLRNKQNIFLALLWLSLVFSYWFGAYAGKLSYFSAHSAWVYSLTNNIFIMYFISVLEINETRKVRWFVIVFVLSSIHLMLWANFQYLSQNWSQFNHGRLMGPRGIGGGSIYGDENAFAMFLVCGLPFIFYWGMGLKSKIYRWLVWSTLPLCCHAIFLTGSRGGLLGIGTIVLSTIALSRRKLFSIPIIFIFLGIFQFQAGDVMKSRSGQIANIEGERSASDRVVAWQGGVRMMLNHPLNGVGLGMFEATLPNYIESRQMVAHNTLIQFVAESGVFAGLAYVCAIILFFRHAIKIFFWSRFWGDNDEVKRIHHYNNACTVSFAGLVVCSFFLSLNTYEIFFVLLLLNNSIYQICSSKFWSGRSHGNLVLPVVD